MILPATALFLLLQKREQSVALSIPRIDRPIGEVAPQRVAQFAQAVLVGLQLGRGCAGG